MTWWEVLVTVSDVAGLLIAVLALLADTAAVRLRAAVTSVPA